jgi:PhnB protein
MTDKTTMSGTRRVLGAQERSRIPLPDGTVMTVEVSFGDSPVGVASESPERRVMSPLTPDLR